jgi:hypothetical protein
MNDPCRKHACAIQVSNSLIVGLYKIDSKEKL